VKPTITMRRALKDPKLFGPILKGPSWLGWRALLIASMGEKLTAEEREAFARLTGRLAEPGERVDEFWGVVGRRGGKSRASSVLAVYLAALCEHPNVAVGEKPIVLFIAENQKQAAICFNYASGILEATPLLRELVVGRTQDTISLANGVSLEIRAASFRGLRGPTFLACVADEAAFYAVDDAVNADTEVLNAVRPGLATTGGPLIVISSPYAKRGEVWGTFKRYYGSEGDPLILVAKGSSRDFNPSLSQKVVDRAYERDAAAAAAEFGGEFRSDLERFISLEVVEGCVPRGCYERAPASGVIYFGFCDPSGGSDDSMTLAITHRDRDGRAILDVLRERRPPFSPENVVAEFAQLLKSYRLVRIEGDHYAGAWPIERFRIHGITYEPCARPKSELYADLLPLLNSGRCELLDHRRLVDQLVALERRTGRTGKDTTSHPPNAHDDVCNAAAGALVRVYAGRSSTAEMMKLITPALLARTRFGPFTNRSIPHSTRTRVFG